VDSNGRFMGRRTAFSSIDQALQEIADGGVVARRPDLERCAAVHGLPMITIADLVEHRLRSEMLVERCGEAGLVHTIRPGTSDRASSANVISQPV
jgi:hypothetical protein